MTAVNRLATDIIDKTKNLENPKVEIIFNAEYKSVDKHFALVWELERLLRARTALYQLAGDAFDCEVTLENPTTCEIHLTLTRYGLMNMVTSYFKVDYCI